MAVVRKKGWCRAREIFPAICGVIKEQGNSARFHPSIPSEYIGKRAILVILEEDREILGDKNE